MTAALLVVGTWLVLIVVAFVLCRAADDGDARADRAFERRNGGWRNRP